MATGDRLIFAGMMVACVRQHPIELLNDNKELPQEGMMFVGDSGKILAGFNVQNPQIISGKKMEAPPRNCGQPKPGATNLRSIALFVNACKTGKQYPGNFMEAELLPKRSIYMQWH